MVVLRYLELTFSQHNAWHRGKKESHVPAMLPRALDAPCRLEGDPGLGFFLQASYPRCDSHAESLGQLGPCDDVSNLWTLVLDRWEVATTVSAWTRR